MGNADVSLRGTLYQPKFKGSLKTRLDTPTHPFLSSPHRYQASVMRSGALSALVVLVSSALVVADEELSAKFKVNDTSYPPLI